VTQFRHMLEARHITIFTDHKLITYALKQKQDKCSPVQPPRLCCSVHDRHTTHLRTEQRCRQRPLSRRVLHCATIVRRTGRIARQRRRPPNTLGVNRRLATRETIFLGRKWDNIHENDFKIGER
jgi:hypothetical protein